MALIYGVNYVWNPSIIPAMCAVPKCTYVSAFILKAPRYEHGPIYYCLDHLLIAARNIHHDLTTTETWL